MVSFNCLLHTNTSGKTRELWRIFLLFCETGIVQVIFISHILMHWKKVNFKTRVCGIFCCSSEDLLKYFLYLGTVIFWLMKYLALKKKWKVTESSFMPEVPLTICHCYIKEYLWLILGCSDNNWAAIKYEELNIGFYVLLLAI